MNYRFFYFLHNGNNHPKNLGPSYELEKIPINGEVNNYYWHLKFGKKNYKKSKLLRELIDEAQYAEWENYISEIVIKNNNRIQEKLTNSLDYFLQSNYVNLSDDSIIKYLNSGITPRDLEKTANKIANRKTIIAIPKYYEKDIKQELIEEISKSIHEILINESYKLGLLCIESKNSISQNGPYKKIINNILLLMWSTASDSKNGINIEKCRRPGAILLEGETGTGKSMGAHLISQYLSKDLYTINLASVTDSLLENKIRGHKKGAFTGAISEEKGAFETANKKALLLDELQSASMETQSQLLDLLSAISDEVTLSPIGENTPNTFTVKLFFAVNEPLEKLLKQGKIRHDLVHRIRQIITLPPLRERLNHKNNTNSDIRKYIKVLLTIYRYNWQRPWVQDDNIPNPFIHINDKSIDKIINTYWPGNFRQFERFAHDIFEDSLLDKENSTHLSDNVIQKLIEKEENRNKLHYKISNNEVTTDNNINCNYNNDPETYKINIVQKILHDNNYVIKKSVNTETFKNTYSLGSNQSLRNYLIKNWDNLNEQTRKQANIIKFIK